MPCSETRDELILVGAIAGAHGLKGEVRLMSFTAEPTVIADYGTLHTEDGRSFEILTLKKASKGFQARLSGVSRREDAEALKSTRLYVPRSALPPTDEDEHYHADLIGLRADDLTGEPAGRVSAVFDFGAGDLLEIDTGMGNSFFVPFTKEAVPKIDVGAGFVIIDPPPETEPETEQEIEPDTDEMEDAASGDENDP